MGMGMRIDFANPMGMGYGYGMIFENGYGCGYSSTRPVPAPRPSPHYPYLYKNWPSSTPRNSGKFMAIFTGLTLLEKISKLLTNSYGGEIISPQKKLHHGCWQLGFSWAHAEKIKRIEIHLESLAGQRNGGGKRNNNRGAHVRGTGWGFEFSFFSDEEKKI